MRRIVSIYVFSNGNVAVLDDKGKQVPKLQINLLTWMRKQGYIVDCNRINEI